MRSKTIIGIDEVGRGPLAGPVGVGVVLVPANFDWKKLPGVTDSKKLTEAKREQIYIEALGLKKVGALDFAVAMVSAPVIDRVGIVSAINLAMSRALNQVCSRSHLEHAYAVVRGETSNYSDVMVKLDGGLKAPNKYPNQETIIKGDGKVKEIGLASIVAKVTRDRYMVRKSQCEMFAPYSFAAHKGYGTKAHRAAIVKYGLSSLHRHSYCKNLLVT